MYFDAQYWSHFFEDSFARQVRALCDVLRERVLPAFADAGTEAEVVANREFERLGQLTGGDGGPLLDPADAAEMAHEAGLAHYEMLVSAEQTFLNLSAAALHHLFEQQLLVFHRRQVLHPSEEDDPSLNSLRELVRRLRLGGVDMESFPTWSVIDELRLAANTVKHGEGGSAEKLRTRRPLLFTPPSLHGTQWDEPLGTVAQPLAGEDIYVTLEDITRYRDALVAFWSDLGKAILASQNASAT